MYTTRVETTGPGLTCLVCSRPSGWAKLGHYPPTPFPWPLLQSKATAPRPGVEATLQERLALYQTAIESAKQAGDGAKIRRYDRGLKTLENLLASVRKGNAIDEEDIPPPVAIGKGPAATPSHTPVLTPPASVNLLSPEPRVTVEGPPPTVPASSLGLAKPQLPPGRPRAGLG